jgi:hypothetical protein
MTIHFTPARVALAALVEVTATLSVTASVLLWRGTRCLLRAAASTRQLRAGDHEAALAHGEAVRLNSGGLTFAPSPT